MNEYDHNRILQIWPEYDQMPAFLSTEEASAITGMKTESLAKDRCGARRIGFIRGRPIRYPKTAIAAWLLKNAVAVGSAAEL